MKCTPRTTEADGLHRLAMVEDCQAETPRDRHLNKRALLLSYDQHLPQEMHIVSGTGLFSHTRIQTVRDLQRDVHDPV